MFAMLAELDSGDDDSDQGLDRICPEPQQKTKIAQKETTQQRQAQPKEKKKFQKFSVELQKKKDARDKINGVDQALSKLSLKKKLKNQQKKNKKAQALALLEEEEEDTATTTESDSDAEKADADAAEDDGAEEVLEDSEKIIMARESAKVRLTLVSADGEHALPEGSYTPVTSFSVLTALPAMPSHLVEACLATIPAFVKGEDVKPSAVQAECWGALLAARPDQPPPTHDLIAVSYTGSGKTLAFLLPTFHRLCTLPSTVDPTGIACPRALVVAPTRELALQIVAVAQTIAAHPRINQVAMGVVGGVGFEFQRKSVLKELPSVVVATPGRLLALCGAVSTSARKTDQADNVACMSLEHVKVLVLDEADRLLDMGFELDIKEITVLIATRRRQPGSFMAAARHPQTILTTATWEEKMNSLALSLVRPGSLKILVGEKDLSAAKTVRQVVEVMPKKGAARDKRLVALLQSILCGTSAVGAGTGGDDGGEGKVVEGAPRVLVFALFKKEAQQVSQLLLAKGISSAHLHGDMSQNQRSNATAAFRAGHLSVLVATDVAARGLDIPEVTHVVNYSLGLSVDHYIHRIGRCGRAGRTGTAHTFLVDYDHKFTPELMQVLQQARQEVPPELLELANIWTSKLKHGKSAGTRGEAAWAKNDTSKMNEDQLAEYEARQANREKQMQLRKYGHQKGGAGGGGGRGRGGSGKGRRR